MIPATTAEVIPFHKLSKPSLTALHSSPTSPTTPSPESAPRPLKKRSRVVRHQTVDPIKDAADIQAAKAYLLSQPNKWKSRPTNLRNYMMFVININNGLRISDLLSLRICDVLSPSGEIVDDLTIQEEKTRKSRPVFFGPESKAAILNYLAALPSYKPSDYLFSSCRVSSKKGSAPLSRIQAWRIIHDMGEVISADRDKKLHWGTHTMRKTFGYQRLARDPENQMLLTQISEMYNHSTLSMTYKYLGIDKETKRALCTDVEL